MNYFVHKSFFVVWFIAMTIVGVLPFDLDIAKKKITPTKWIHKKIISVAALVLFVTRWLAMVFRLYQAVPTWRDNMQDLCMRAFYSTIYMNNTMFMITFLRHTKAIALTFNQVTEMVENSGNWTKRRKVTLPEAVILTWIPGHADIVVSMTVLFMQIPTAGHQMFSFLPENLQNQAVLYKAFLIVEFLTALFFVCNSISEYAMQVYLISAFIHVTDEIRSEMASMKPVTAADYKNSIAKYRMVQILLWEYTTCFGKSVERTKTSLSMFNIMSNVVLIRFGSKISRELFSWLLNVATFTGTLPPLLFNSAFKVYTNTVEAKRMTYHKSRFVNEADRGYALKAGRALRPLRIVVAGMYFLDRSFTPLFYKIIIESTISFLVA